MITQYEIENVLLADCFSKSRKIEKLNLLKIDDSLKQAVKIKILKDESLETVMDRAEDDDKNHWIQFFGVKAGIDLLTIGKVQPENMLSMALLPTDDFRDSVKIAVETAKKLNEQTKLAEKEINLDLLPDNLI